MKKILVLNSGSSSIKFQLFDMQDRLSLASGLVEKIGESQSSAKLKIFVPNISEIKETKEIKNHKEGLEIVEELLQKSKLLNSFDELCGIGHRVVHGGERFRSSVVINDEVIKAIKDVTPLAPLHNPANLDGIEVAIKKAPNIKQVAVFDTAFHQSIPKYAYLYGLPYEMYERYGVRRYGFHGTSHFYVAKEAARFLNIPLNRANLITLHLGNGASVCAIENGKSIDTSMGLTPLEGLIMGTRSGDIDPAIIFYLARVANKSIDELDRLLNKESGLKGICGANDLREIIERSKNGDEKATLALLMFSYRIKKYIGSYVAVLGRVDAIVFTGGIGEHSATIREMVCGGGLEEAFGIKIDINKDCIDEGKIVEISEPQSKIKVLIVPTNEELEIAEQTFMLVNG